MNTSSELNELYKAISIAQGQIPTVIKDNDNPFFKSKFVSMKALKEAIRAPLANNGLCYIINLVSTANGVSASTRVAHSSGQWLEVGPLEIPLAKKDAQQIGSASTYLERYTIKTVFGVACADDSDDDGESAMGRTYTENRRADSFTSPVKPVEKEPVEKIPGEPLTEAQCAELDALLNDDIKKETVISKTCEKYNLKSIYSIDSNMFVDVKNWLLNRKKMVLEKKQ